MNVEKKVPEIRFKGFSGEWDETTLGSLCLIGDIDHRMPESKVNGVPYLMTGDFTGINELNFDNSKLISLEDYEQLSRKIKPEYGDIIFARYASVGAVRYVETEKKFLVSYSCAILKTSGKSYGRYLFYRLQTSRSQNQIELDINTGSQRNIGIDSLKNMAMILPKPNEQTQIGNTFQKLDSLINQHQQQHDQLSNIKKAMLEKMFPKPGETIPEIRFKGFSGEWNEACLGDMVTCFSGGTPLVGVEEYYKGDIPFIRSAEINKASTELTISEFGLKNSSAKIVEVGTVLYALYGATSGEVGRAKLGGAINQAILAIIPMAKVCPEFLSQWLRKSKNSIVSTYLQGGQGNLSGDIVKNLVLMSPTFEEQTAIGNYFQKLDALINQHQQQITKLTHIKQACLSKMFV